MMIHSFRTLNLDVFRVHPTLATGFDERIAQA
jgi:hypothetical protein